MSIGEGVCIGQRCQKLYFFFQGEDGIRYLVRSRGLEDVYKRRVGKSEAERLPPL